MEKPSGGSGEWRVASAEKNLGAVAPVSRVFAYEWQGKDLRDTECVRVASKGLTKRHFCASVQRTSSRRGMPPRVFCKKSPQAIENKRSERGKERKERRRVCKSVTRQDLGTGLATEAQRHTPHPRGD